jgi:hypothetical protein
MSLVDSSGKPIDTDMLGPVKVYEISGIRMKSPLSPNQMLERALIGAQQGIAQNVGMSVLAQGGSEAQAQAAASKAASEIRSPFQVEPCAEAIFMIVAQEIARRDKLISALSERLHALDGKDLPDLDVQSGPMPEAPEPAEKTEE